MRRVTNLNHPVVLVPSENASGHTIRALEVGPDAVRAGLALGLLVEYDGADRVQGYAIPYEL